MTNDEEATLWAYPAFVKEILSKRKSQRARIRRDSKQIA